MTTISGPGPSWKAPLYIWLKSKFIDSDVRFRFDSSYAEPEAANWPLGVPLARAPDAEVGVATLIDSAFDWHVKNAWVLPRRYSGLSTGISSRRERANLTIRNVGHWDGEPRHYENIVSAIAARNPRDAGDRHRRAYAITPFSIIGQSWLEGDGSQAGEITDTYIAFFYTYETFIQECLALDAHRSGTSPDDIAGAYQHLYANVVPQHDAIPRDPAALKLARFAGPSINWSDLRATAESVMQKTGRHSGNPAWSIREQLFFCRLQTHLMAALAVACHGVASFSGQATTPLLRIMASPPDVAQLAPAWLAHASGRYDHTAECAALLQRLARHYGQELSERLRGMPIPAFRRVSTADEESVVFVWPPVFGVQDRREGIDCFRWRLFDAGLDDQSVIRWEQDVRRWVDEGDQHVQ